jgi:hypothetical protein
MRLSIYRVEHNRKINKKKKKILFERLSLKLVFFSFNSIAVFVRPIDWTYIIT